MNRLLAALVAIILAGPVMAQDSYQIVPAGDGGGVWQLNTVTGQLRYCLAATSPYAVDCTEWR